MAAADDFPARFTPGPRSPFPSRSKIAGLSAILRCAAALCAFPAWSCPETGSHFRGPCPRSGCRSVPPDGFVAMKAAKVAVQTDGASHERA